MKTVILAGGLGTRISEETQLKPKPMIEIGGKPILWHIMKIFSHFGFNEFIICCGYKGEVIKDFFKNSMEPWSIELVDTGLETMTGGRIKKIEEFLENQSFFLTYGDDLKAVDILKLLQFHNKHKKLVTLTAVQPPGRFGILDIKGNDVTSILEKPPGDGNWINGGYYVLEPDIFDKIHDDSDVWETNPLQNLIQKNQVSVFKYNDVYQPLDTMNDKEKLQKLWNSNNAYWKIWK
jgi:glucose-1-phosphate cytidylyltransferase